MQVTAGSLTGRFGSQAKYWGERLLAEGFVHILATDAHGLRARAPLLGEGRQAAERWIGAKEAEHLVVTRPQGILDDIEPAQLPGLPDVGCNGLGSPVRGRGKKNWMGRWLGGRGA
jgi:protein-tyrosine phosphatase